MKRMTQVQKITNALKRGETLTMLSGLRFNTLNLHKRLDETGLPIEKTWVTRGGKKRRAFRLAA